MYLLELQAQGVKGCSPSVRAPLKPGYAVLKPTATPPPPMMALVAAVLYSDGRGGDASFAADGAKGKVGFTILGNDQVTYRLMRELGGAGVLQKLNKATTTFELVSDNAADIGTYLRATVGLPSRSAFEQIFTCTAAQMPSRRPRAVKGGAAALGTTPARPSMAHTMPVEPASDIPAAQAKVAELEKELKSAKDIEALQFQQDGITRQMDELEQKMKGSEGLRSALEQARSEVRSAPDTVSLGLPADIVHKAQRYQDAVQRRDEALAKLGADPSADEPVAPPPSSAVEPLWRNQQFLGSAGLGAVFMVAGVLLSGYGRAIALLDIPAFAFAALTAIKHVEDLQGSTQVSKKGSLRAQREKKIHDTFESEVAPVKGAMKSLGVETADEVVKVLEQKPLLEERVAALQQQLQQWEAEPANRQVSAQYHKLKQQVEAINQKLQAEGGYIREAREVERELQRTKESIQKAQGGVPAGASAAATTAQLTSAPGSTSELEDPGPSLMRLAADLFQSDVPALAGMVRDRANQYFSALTDRRYSGLEQDAGGAISALSQGKKLKVGAIPSRDLDLLYLSLRLTLVEKYSARAKVPMFLENDLGVEDAKLGLLSRMLKHLGTLTQVVHVTAHPAFPAVADLNGTL